MTTNMTPGNARWILVVVAALVPTFFGVGIWQFISHLGSSDPSTTVPSVFPTAPTGVATIPTGPASAGPSASGEPSAGAPSGPVNTLSATGYSALRDAVRKSTGTTKIFEATIYPGYAVLEIPAGKSGNTQHFYRWDGAQLSDLNAPATLASSGRVDLASVRPAVVQQLSERARRTLVKNPTTWYVLIRTDPVTSQPSVYAYANNAAAHGGYLLASPAGKVLRKTTW